MSVLEYCKVGFLILGRLKNFCLYSWANKNEKWQCCGNFGCWAFFASCGPLDICFWRNYISLFFRISSFEDGHQQHWRPTRLLEVGPRPPWKDRQPYPTGNSWSWGVAAAFHRQTVQNHKNCCIFKHDLVVGTWVHRKQSKQQTHSHIWQGIPLKTKSLMLPFRKLGTR